MNESKIIPQPLPGARTRVMNWNMTEQSSCYVFKAQDLAGIRQALTMARANGLSIIPHGAGHSYTDAALNTDGILLDVTGMRRILSWDPEQGIIQVEPGATLREVVRVALPNHWWPAVTPSTADATIGGCVALNVNGKNAWKCGSFGEHLLSLNVLLATGQELTLSPESDPALFHAFVGSAGLLGIITSITIQLEHVPSTQVEIRMRPADSLGETLAIMQQEQSADFLEAWVDSFATGGRLGRGVVTCTRYGEARDGFPATTRPAGRMPASRKSSLLKENFTRGLGQVGRPAVRLGVHTAASTLYWWTKWWDGRFTRRESLFDSTYYAPAIYTIYRALAPQGTETFQAFVPASQAEALFDEILRRSQANGLILLWSVIKRHRRDPFLLSYQVDGFSLEVNYQVMPQVTARLGSLLRELMARVVQAGGRFYFAKDSLLTNALYRQSIGDVAVDTFLQLKRRYDPEMLLQSNLFRRVFLPTQEDTGAQGHGDAKTRERGDTGT